MIATSPDAADAAVRALTIGDGTLTATILTRGAILNDLRHAAVPYGMTLGTRDTGAYRAGMAYFGAIVGPVANRIAGARATIAGVDHRFAANQGPNLLHSGDSGTHAQIWTVDSLDETARGTGGFGSTGR